MDVIIDGDLFDKSKETIGKANEGMENQNVQQEQIKNIWDEVPGKVIKSNTKLNSTIQIKVVVTDITRNSFRVNVTGFNDFGDTLTYTLKIGDKTYEEKTGEEVYWDIENLKEGTTYEYEVIAKDSMSENNVEGEVTTLDNKVPKVTVAVSEITPIGATITATGTDEENDEIQYTLEVNGKNYGPSTTNVWPIKDLEPETEYEYTVTVTDGYDTIEKTGEFTTEKVLLAIESVTGNPTDWVNTDVTLTVNAEDPTYGLHEKAYSFDGGTTWQESNKKTYTGNTNDIVVKVKNSLGIIATYEKIDITKIDKIPPVLSSITNSSNEEWTNSAITLSWTIKEDDSGIEKVEYGYDGKTFEDSLETDEWYGLTRSNERDDVLYIIVTDNAGNVSNIESSAMRIDRTAPTCEISASVTTATIITYTFTFSESVIDFTVDDIEVANGIIRNFSGSETTYILGVRNSASTNHTQTVSIASGVCTDTAGNENEAASKSMTINRDPSLSVTVSNIGTTTATITATGSDSDGDTLQYTLFINGTQVAGPSETYVWELADLTEYQTYGYTVQVTDGIATSDSTGSFKTYCRGGTETTETCDQMTLCDKNKQVTTAPCGECDSTGVIGCPGGTANLVKDSSYDADAKAPCPVCGREFGGTAEKWYDVTITCSACSKIWDLEICWNCYELSSDIIIAASGYEAHIGTSCEDCKGLGSITTESYDSECSRCGLTGKHYYCDTHSVSSYTNSHTYTEIIKCEHDKTDPHND